MSSQAFLDPSLVAARRRIRQLYETGEMPVEVATVKLLRIDIDALKQARGLNKGPEAIPNCLSDC